MSNLSKKGKGTGYTYAKAGVDIDKKSRVIHSLTEKLNFKRRGFGSPVDLEEHFTGCIDIGDSYLSLCTDGVGTKLLVANSIEKWDTVGIDCIAMNVNDMICIGAEPLAFVDYIAIDKPNEKLVGEVGIGLSKGAEMANVSIIGGEVAVLPEIVNGFDLAGTCLGIVRKDDIITGKDIKLGDAIIGMRSSGIHSNGLTLARKVFENKGYTYTDKLSGGSRSIGLELLEPTTIYVPYIMEITREFNVHGMANITGGGLRNLVRLKHGVEFRLDSPFKPQKVFDVLQELGNITDQEMYQTFNMGMGFCLIVGEEDAEEVISSAKGKIDTKRVGTVLKGDGVSLPSKGLKYAKY